jgi:hypothetical protein
MEVMPSVARPCRLAAVSVLGSVLALLYVPGATASRKPVPPAISFTVTPDLIVCRDPASPHEVRASWQITHGVSTATITGGVAFHGEAPKSVVIVHRQHARPVHGTTKVFVLCTGSNQSLMLSASGPGGSSSAGAVVREVRAA